MRELSANIQPGNAASFVLVKNMTADKVLNEIKDAGGIALKTGRRRKCSATHSLAPQPHHRPAPRPRRQLDEGSCSTSRVASYVASAIPLQRCKIGQRPSWLNTFDVYLSASGRCWGWSAALDLEGIAPHFSF